ncbi:MAG: lipase family protein [Campylobacterota bacterium]|nr:lipase family protein [Campylobacterota bacterium]
MIKNIIALSVAGIVFSGCMAQPKTATAKKVVKPTVKKKVIKNKPTQQTKKIVVDKNFQYLLPSDKYSKKIALEIGDIAKSVFNDSYGSFAFKRHGYKLEGHQSISQGLVDLQFAYAYKMVSKKNMVIVVAVRGSKEATDWGTDANYMPKAYNTKIDKDITIHGGFLSSATLLEKQEKNCKINSLPLNKLIKLNAEGKRNDIFLITGHSLGGAIATIYTTKLRDRGIRKDQLLTYTFGAPPISMSEGASKNKLTSSSIIGKFGGMGSALMADMSAEKVDENEVNYYIDRYTKEVNLFRLYDSNDIVPKLFAPTRHLGTPIGFEGKYGLADLRQPMKIIKTHNMGNYMNQIKNDNFIK